MMLRLFLILGVMVATGVAGVPTANATEEDVVIVKHVRKAGAESRSGKKENNKIKSPELVDEEEDEEEIAPADDWYVMDQDSWAKMEALNLEEARLYDVGVTDFVDFMNKTMRDNQLDIEVKCQLESALNTKPRKLILSVNNVSSVELLRMACQQLRCVFTVENGVVCLYDSRHLFSRTYDMTREELYMHDNPKKDLHEVLSESGVQIPENGNASFNASGDKLTVLAPLFGHGILFQMCKEFAEMKENLPKAVTIFKKYYSTLRKVGKAATKVRPGKNAQAKFAKLKLQLKAACSEKDAELLSYYLCVKPSEYKKLDKLVNDLWVPMENTIDSLYENDEAANEADALFFEMRRFIKNSLSEP